MAKGGDEKIIFRLAGDQGLMVELGHRIDPQIHAKVRALSFAIKENLPQGVMETIRILAPGGYTTIQDRGRFGYQHMGVPVSGALDNFAFTLANLLVGNPENRAALELTVMGSFSTYVGGRVGGFQGRTLISEPSIPGSIQIPPEGNPIILGVEQTVGGYAKIATIISLDFPIIAQTIPGNTIGFERIDLNTAHGRIIENQIKIKAIKKSFSRA